MNHTNQLPVNRHVFLIGFMGVGKTTYGKKLSEGMGLPFLDMDELFVARENMSISDFFAAHGETSFREKEREILHSLVNLPASIIATGGGSPCHYDNMEWMNKQGITVYLHMPAKALAQRLANSKRHKRPLIKDLNEDELLQFIEERMQQREYYYKQAALHMPVPELDMESIMALIRLKE